MMTNVVYLMIYCTDMKISFAYVIWRIKLFTYYVVPVPENIPSFMPNKFYLWIKNIIKHLIHIILQGVALLWNETLGTDAKVRGN